MNEKYVSVAGAGAHDGSSAANAWTLAEMVTNIVATDRANIISGTYTLTGNITFPSGSNEAPIEYRGYNSTIGDLDVARTGTGKHTTTNWPLIDATSSGHTINLGALNKFVNINFTSAHNSTTVTLNSTLR